MSFNYINVLDFNLDLPTAQLQTTPEGAEGHGLMKAIGPHHLQKDGICLLAAPRKSVLKSYEQNWTQYIFLQATWT